MKILVMYFIIILSWAETNRKGPPPPLQADVDRNNIWPRLTAEWSFWDIL